MDKSALVVVLSIAGFFLFMLGLIVHSVIQDRREENEKLRKKLAMSNYVNEVERAMKEGKRLTDPEAIRRFHAALDARRDPDK